MLRSHVSAMRIYLDHNATTPLDPPVADRMAQALRDVWGNARASTTSGSRPRPRSTRPAAQVAALLGAEPSEVVFTAGGTESDNFAIRGAAEALEPTGRKHLDRQAIEHEAVLNTSRRWRGAAGASRSLPVDASGIVSIRARCARRSPTTRRSSR